MKYNTQRKKLKFMDYGRSVEGLIQYAKTIEDREKRNQVALAIVDAMARVVPRSRENAGWKRRMWDHMMVLSNWELDVDWPVWAGRKPEVVPEESMIFKPNRLKYKDKGLRYRHYGRVLTSMIAKAKAMPEGAERNELVRQIVEAMKLSYSTWNTSSVSVDVIYKQLYEMSGGVLDIRNSRPAQTEIVDNTQTTENNEQL